MSHVLEPLTISQVARVFSVSLILLSLRTPSWLLSLVHKYSLFFFFFSMSSLPSNSSHAFLTSPIVLSVLEFPFVFFLI